MNLRVSATDIDAYRRFRADEDADLATFLADMRKWTAPTPAMQAGTALHKALETAKPGSFEKLEADGFTFYLPVDAVIDLPDIRECKATREYQVGDVLVTMVGKVDAVCGNRIDDHKFTGSFDAERFLSSYQWKIYLEIFGADEFRWNVFEGRETDPQVYVIWNVHPLRMHRYPGMAADIEAELERWVEFVGRFMPERMKQ